MLDKNTKSNEKKVYLNRPLSSSMIGNRNYNSIK